MSSPIASPRKNFFKGILVNVHQKLSHNHRVDILSKIISDYIENYFVEAEKIRCLDVGCGDMQIAEKISEYNSKTIWSCIDIHDLPEHLKGNIRWLKYKKFDGVRFPFDSKSIDVVLFCDVLHHDQDNALNLLSEAARVGKMMIVKDHFEYSMYSRVMLKVMDFMGNWGYGVKFPRKYFTIQSFDKLCREASLDVKKIDIGIDLYSHLHMPHWFLKPEWHFIALLGT